MSLVVAVLAGGGSRRMGRDKASLELGGRALIGIVSDAAWDAGATRLLWVGERGAAPHAGRPWSAALERVADPVVGAGPLGGAAAAARHTGEAPMLVLPCDLPWLTGADLSGLLHELAGRRDRPAVGRRHGRRRPDVAWWTPEALSAARAAFAGGERALHALQDGGEWTEVPLGAGFDDVDTPGDLAVSDTVAPMSIPEITPEDVASRLGEGVHLLDVRELHEYQDFHVPGAHHIPLGEVAGRLGEIPEGEVMVICRSGVRSLKVCEQLRATGREAMNVAGGTLAWIESGRAVTSGSERG